MSDKTKQELLAILKDLLSRQGMTSKQEDDYWLQYLGSHLEVVKEAYLAYRNHERFYVHQLLLSDKLIFQFDEQADSAQIETRHGGWSFQGTLSDFVTLMATIDMVYAPIYPIGTVVNLDMDLFPDFLRELFAEEPGAKVMLTGRKLDLHEGYEGYTLDYTARLWPLGERLGSTQLRVSNLMIKKVIALGYHDDAWESRVADALHQKQLNNLQRSTAFMSSEEALAYYHIDLEGEVD